MAQSGVWKRPKPGWCPRPLIGAIVRDGTSPEGLPIGVQAVARPWREDIALALASRVESVLGGWHRPPVVLAHHLAGAESHERDERLQIGDLDVGLTAGRERGAGSRASGDPYGGKAHLLGRNDVVMDALGDV